jgi:hypothetical protein
MCVEYLLESTGADLLALQWPAPPRNILVVRKKGDPTVTRSVVEFAKYGFLIKHIVAAGPLIISLQSYLIGLFSNLGDS